ncbi:MULTISPECIES: HAD-IC family P-type ATPase [Arthrobacter]|uniref:HAD-IC family P-type ATPase n=2 Tax=Arthrobacter TaxID=1663 RepID=A0ABU9KRK4_9MICC|nr:HAD-IC family P-type ATPase [Arthrobacter sp. YJM1]MDP5227958.1 HAD-IC family P-type ATPase [Arthrobacter sp. YJM1]
MSTVQTLHDRPDAPLAGLSEAEVAERVAAGAVNRTEDSTGRSIWDIVRSNVFTRINAIFAVLAAIVVSTGYFIDAAFGLLIIANSVVGIIQEVRAKRTLDRLAIVGQAKPRVRRDGTTLELPPEDVVRDDLIELGPGDQVMVDGEVLTAAGLEVDESLLTGESDAMAKAPGSEVLSGSFVSSGTGMYRATKVGSEAYAAKISAEASKFSLVDSELRNGINKILKVITWLLLPAGALSIYNQLSGRQALPDALRGMVAALVPMVPEGLVLMTTIAFAVGVIRLGRRQCLVNELPAIEGLARVDVVCADKTGTLTENAMRLGSLEFPVHDDAAAPERANGAAGRLAASVLAALAASDPRPNASIEAIAEAYPDVPGWTVVDTLPFASSRKYSGASFSATDAPETDGAWLLGAPDVLLDALASSPAAEASAVAHLDVWHREAERFGSQGLRVLLLARARELDAATLTAPAALVVLEQKIRAEAPATLEYFAGQNVEVKIISGDNAGSVGAVAHSLKLPGAERTVDARTLPSDAEALAEEVQRGTVFGRVTPDQKRAMVGALKSKGHTVAMTGDGVNDVLALKDADIGVAMGAGSPATRAVAQIVLLDNSFATLPHVVAEGRRVIGNIERVATLFLTKTVYSVLLAILVGMPGLIGLAQVPYPFLPRHVTIVGWFTIGLPAFVLSLAPNHDRAQPGFASRVLRRALPAGVVVGVASFVSYLLVRGDAVPQAQSSTAALLTLMSIALWVLAIVARPYTWWKVLLLVAMIGGTLTMFLLPVARAVLQLEIGSSAQLWTAFGCAAAGIVLVEIAWILGNRKRSS